MENPPKANDKGGHRAKLEPSSMQSLQKLENIDLRGGFAIDRTKAKAKQGNIAGDKFNPMASTTDLPR